MLIVNIDLSKSDGKFVLKPKASAAGVFRHSQIVKYQAHVAHELSHFLRDTAYPFGLNDAHCKPEQAREILRAMALRMRLRSL